ncbi:MAG: type 1 glutamine amidotransferase domain-containing protein [Myxococcales bacterium]
MGKRVLVPLPDRDFDTTEVSVPWRLLTRAGHQVVFATERGVTPACDPRLLTGVIFGRLGARPEPIAFYRELEQAPEFQRPLAWPAIDPATYDALLLPGGHAPGMRQYLGSGELQGKVAAFWKLGRPVAAICHGVLLLARSVDPETGQSVLSKSRTTCLVKPMERMAYYLTAWRLGRYYRTYPAYVEDEVKAALADPAVQFFRGPMNLGRPASADDDRLAFVVEDGRYLSARWPGDAYLFAKKLLERLA